MVPKEQCASSQCPSGPRVAKCTKIAKSGETALVEELTANALPGGDKAGSQGVQPLVNNLFHPSGAIKRGHKGCNPLSTMRFQYLR